MADFTNIDGIYAKDTELRSGIDTLRTTVLSNTIKPLTVTKNDTYTAIPSSGTYGYSPIIVDVQEEPWTPLEDGYSNFWFELTNDTLSPWLNFSAKNNDAVIDWGDGSGEVALDTLTPTHTYSKAGRYVVKVKGVTGIARQMPNLITNDDSKWFSVLKAVELNTEVTAIIDYAFINCVGLENFVATNSLTAMSQYAFRNCSMLKSFIIPQDITTLNLGAFYSCFSLLNVIIPNAVTTFEGVLFYQCVGLTSIHIQATTPPTFSGSNHFYGLPTGYLIYVPVGYGDTYKSATGWSTYADHIVEEGQSLSMAALRRIQAEKNDDIEEMRR